MTATIAALFVEAGGAYAHLKGVETWPEDRDARTYDGPHVVIAHPPCSTWSQLAKVNEKRYGHAVGDDAGCFASALASVQRWGGVLEHPAYSHAWPRFALPRPVRGAWSRCLFASIPEGRRAWVTEVSQSAYGHQARKRTWLYVVARHAPEALDWRDLEGTAWCGWNNPDRERMRERGKRTLSKAESKATPPAFSELLLSIARSCA